VKTKKECWNNNSGTRYVDTFEVEDEIDIETIANELKSLEETIKATDSTIAEFCKELGIATLF
jgi:type I restriction enzyme M protein